MLRIRAHQHCHKVFPKSLGNLTRVELSSALTALTSETGEAQEFALGTASAVVVLERGTVMSSKAMIDAFVSQPAFALLGMSRSG